MSTSAISAPPTTRTPVSSAGEELAALGWELNANQYRVVHLAARFDEELDWFRLGHTSASSWMSMQLQVQTSTAREWIRVGHALRHLPLIDEAFAAQEISYAKVRILTRWADDDNEARLLELARQRTAGRLTVAIAKVLVAAVDELVRRIAETPMGEDSATADGVDESEPDLSADAFDEPSVVAPSPIVASVPETSPGSLPATLRELRRRWQPDSGDDWVFPSLGQQRADAFVALFLGCDVSLTTEVVVHVRGDGITFDDGTPTTGHAVVRQLDDSFVRLLIHDAERRPINASSRRRHPTIRQKRVVMEAHGHQCVDCQSTDLLELDHNPPFERTGRTLTHELEPRCAPCHRARHRHDRMAGRARAAELLAVPQRSVQSDFSDTGRCTR